MDWFSQLRQALPAYYTKQHPLDIVGYLQGSASHDTWRHMEQVRQRNQMIVLGNAPPSQREWEAAGVAQRGQVQTIRFSALAGWTVLYGGFVLRPWGKLFELTDEEQARLFPGAINSWVRNMPRRR